MKALKVVKDLPSEPRSYYCSVHLSKQEVDALLALDRFLQSPWEADGKRKVGRPEKIRRAILLAYKLTRGDSATRTADEKAREAFIRSVESDLI